MYGWAENIWEGSNLPAADSEALARTIMNSWMSSSGHRENILSPDYTHLGVGVAASGREIRLHE
ncbi:MAG TPA: CAP domain-containing protein [Desulfobaccales bacterium]|nr:CAP domain-containing protein [Desulfobaccales bacterium]